MLLFQELTELHHENVVALLDCKESANNVFLVMEVSHRNLNDYKISSFCLLLKDHVLKQGINNTSKLRVNKQIVKF